MGISDCSQKTAADDLLFGSSEIMQKLRERVEKVSDTLVPVLIEGESGVGKELLARTIHRRSRRRERNFVKISCSAETDRMPFDRMAVWNAADSPSVENATSETGTILFDNVDELDLARQAKLVTLLDSRIAENVQILCTTKVPLEQRIEEGTFRDDLYHRINVVNFYVPPVRERRVDIPLLAFYFLKHYAEAYERPAYPFSDRLIQLLLLAEWPGNVRELESVVKRYVLLGSEEVIIAELQKKTSLWPSDIECTMPLKALRRNALRDCDYKAILVSLTRNHWNRRHTARELQISYRSLLNAMRELGLPSKRRVDGTATPAPATPRNN